MSSNQTTNKPQQQQQQQASWIWSAVGVGVLVVLLNVVADWHGATQAVLARQSQNQQERHQRLPGRSLAAVITRPLLQEDGGITDDTTRDETCRKYIVNFLNGTTDAKDNCEGLYNAWKAADCKDDKDNVSMTQLPSSVNNHFMYIRQATADNDNDDDDTFVTAAAAIDDAYENWECCESITDYYQKHCQETTIDATRLLGIVSVLIVCGFLRSFLKMTGIRWVPDAGVCIIVGAISGGILRMFSSATAVETKLSFDNDLFLQIMLPPIIFSAALMIDKPAFRRDLFPILTFAVFGTGLSAIAVGYITYHLSGWISFGPSLPLIDSLLFGALMSSIDPVATLSILSSVGVSQTDTLYTLIFGESLLNDGVSIVLFDSLVRHAGDADVVDSATVHATLRDFFIVTTGSVVVGVMSSALATVYFWFLQGKQSGVVEVGLFFAWALVPYYVADGLGFSGIIAILVMGLVVDFFIVGGNESEEGQWMEYMEMPQAAGELPHVQPLLLRFNTAMADAFSGQGHLNNTSRRHVGFVAEVISSLMETAIFAYLGLFLFNEQSWNFMLMTTGIIACVTSRAGMVVSLSSLVNLCVWIDLEGFLGRLWLLVRPARRTSVYSLNRHETPDTLSSDTKVYLDKRTQLIIFSAGVRGAVSYALVQNIPLYNSVTKEGSHFKGELKAMTSATIVVLMFAFGAITYYSVRRDWTPSHDHVAGPLTRRLMSNTLDSQADDDLGDLGSLALEVDNSRPTDGMMNAANNNNMPVNGMGMTSSNLNPQMSLSPQLSLNSSLNSGGNNNTSTMNQFGG